MRIRAARITSLVAVAAVAVLGTAYASAAPLRGAAQSGAAVTTGANPTYVGAMKAKPFALPKRNIAYVYSTSATGGTGEVFYSLPNPPNGVYAASFTANFFPEGTPSTPETFSCFLIVDGFMSTQSTSSSTYTSGFYVGVNGTNTIKVVSGTVITPGCGVADGTVWTFGSRSLQVTLTRLDGMSTGSLTSGSQKAGSASTTTH